MDNLSLESPVVVDVGSHTLKAGLSINFPNDREPSVVRGGEQKNKRRDHQHWLLSSSSSFVVHRPSSLNLFLYLHQKKTLQMIPTTLRDEGSKTLRHTMRDGVVVDWDCLEALLHRTFYGRLGWEAGEEGAALFSEQVLTPRRDRERLTSLCFERFGLAGMFVAESPVLALYSVGRSSGLVADVGHDGASVAAVVDGASVAAGSRRVKSSGGEGEGEKASTSSSSSSAPLGGLAVERALRQRLAARIGEAKAAAVPQDLIRVAKHAVCRVAASSAAAAASASSSTAAAAAAAAADASNNNSNAPSTSKHVLPDGTELEVTAADGVAAGEALVTPFFSSSSSSSEQGSKKQNQQQQQQQQQQHPSLAELLSLALSSIPDTNSRRLASEALMVCGGGSNVAGLAARVVAEGGGSLPPSHPAPPPLLAVPDYCPSQMLSTAAWAGGAILARVVFQQQQHVSRAEYDEFGPTIVHRKAA